LNAVVLFILLTAAVRYGGCSATEQNGK
jgi:hypothetical protein